MPNYDDYLESRRLQAQEKCKECHKWLEDCECHDNCECENNEEEE